MAGAHTSGWLGVGGSNGGESLPPPPQACSKALPPRALERCRKKRRCMGMGGALWRSRVDKEAPVVRKSCALVICQMARWGCENALY